MLKKEFDLAIKGEPDSDGVFEGYASTFGGSPDSYGDIITPGAFAKSLVRHKREGSMPQMFFGHDVSKLPIGDWIDLAEDGKGLWGRGKIALDDPEALRIFNAMKAKRVRGLSIGYRLISSHPDEKMPGVTHLDEIDLFEVSVVNIPANRRSLVTDVKSADIIKEYFTKGETPPLAAIEEYLRDGGFPKALATAFVSQGKSVFRRGDPGDEAKNAAAFLKALRG